MINCVTVGVATTYCKIKFDRRVAAAAFVLALGGVLGFQSHACAASATFIGLGDLTGGSFESRAYGVSADGSVVVGVSRSGNGFEAFRWTVDDGMIGLGDLEGYDVSSVAYGVSSDGNVVTGNGSAELGVRGYRWTESQGLQDLGNLEQVDIHDYPQSVSADGAVIAGYREFIPRLTPRRYEAFRWTEATGIVLLGDLAGGINQSFATDISSNGKVIVGEGTTQFGSQAYRWTESDGMTGLGDLPGGSNVSVAYGVSADGSVIVGISNSSNGGEAFRWTEDGGMEGLGDLAGGAFLSVANAVSDDGKIIVGNGYSAAGLEAFRWTRHRGIENLRDLLIAGGATEAANWHNLDVRSISADGRSMIGWGFNSHGQVEAWKATLPVPEPRSLLLSAVFVLIGLIAQWRRTLV